METAHPLTQPGQLRQRRVRPAAAVEQAIHLVHDATDRPQLRLASAHLPQPRPLLHVEMMADEEMTVFVQLRYPLLRTCAKITCQIYDCLGKIV